jgi:predicted kinase
MHWEQLKNSSIDEILKWAESQSWCHSMAQCQQDVQWHSEGDVWTHTKMVVGQLIELGQWNSLSQYEQTLLTFTAIFHDIAKPSSTEIDPETGRIRSPKHAVKGEHIARSILRELGCELRTREHIAKLVRYHGRPAFLLDREEPVHEVIRLSWLVSNKLLYLFALADTRGRDTDSMTRPEETLHYWRLLSEENNCFEDPYPFATDHARYIFFRQPHPNLQYVPHEDFSCTVTVLSGLPGSGKNTWLGVNRADTPVIALDDIRSALGVEPTENQGQVAQFAWERCRELLREHVSFAFNATNTMRQTRGRWLELFADYRARIEIVYIEPAFASIIKQNTKRQNPVPESVIYKLADKCEPPTWLECHQLILHDN